MQKVKLIWDFFGPDSKNIAKHHLIHLKEFSKSENILFHESNIDFESTNNHFSYIIVNFTSLDFIKDRLKPNRAFKS